MVDSLLFSSAYQLAVFDESAQCDQILAARLFPRDLVDHYLVFNVFQLLLADLFGGELSLDAPSGLRTDADHARNNFV